MVDHNLPLLTVRDKGKLPPGQAVNWVVTSDGITLLAPQAACEPGDLAAQVVEARHLGEISLITLSLAAVPGARMTLTLSGVQRQDLAVGAHVSVRLDLGLVHVMPVRTG